jgi:hypothetical protein
MKRVLFLVLCLCLLVATVTACNKPVTPEPTTPVSSVPAAPSSQPDRPVEDKSLTAKGCPPVPQPLQQLYLEGQEMAAAFSLCHFTTAGVTRQIDGQTYDVISDPRFPTYGALEEYLKELFTEDYVAQVFLNPDSPVKASTDGLACAMQASGAENATYAGHVFRVEKENDAVIQLTATVYYAENGQPGQPFFTAPENPDDYTTRTFAFTFVNSQDGWRISSCPYIRQ